RVIDEEAYKPDAVRSMCCRLQLDLRELLKRGGGLFGSAEMTGSIGVVTINMARLGYLYKGNKNLMYTKLGELMDLAKDTLEKKRVFINQLYQRGLYPYTKRYLPHLRNHFSTIGLNGINEMLRNFSGDTMNTATPDGIAFAEEVLHYMRERIRGYQEETGNLYNLEATPAKGTTHRFAREDLKRYPDIIQSGTPGHRYYTNSSQLPAGYTHDLFKALQMQDKLQCCYTGGTVFHMYMSEAISSPEACRDIVRKVLTNFKMPYITVTPLFSVCDKHGYLKGRHDYCPLCDEELIAKARAEEQPELPLF
ncbi:MAG: ribonucleoside triphosphate reductase, partial [Akkermansia sp.]|nr:ribonucleoside triphosphate reductase [Akkermansia sp.]